MSFVEAAVVTVLFPFEESQIHYNFIPFHGTLWYVDYECNEYMEQWDFAHWGRTYWSRTPELLAHAERQEA